MIDQSEYLDSKILIVDDQASNVMLLQQILSQAGYTNILSTQNPLEVLDLYKQHKPELVLLDLNMPPPDVQPARNRAAREMCRSVVGQIRTRRPDGLLVRGPVDHPVGLGQRGQRSRVSIRVLEMIVEEGDGLLEDGGHRGLDRVGRQLLGGRVDRSQPIGALHHLAASLAAGASLGDLRQAVERLRRWLPSCEADLVRLAQLERDGRVPM